MTDETNLDIDTGVEEEVDPRGKEILGFDPVEVEQEMLRQAQERADDPIEAASAAYSMYVPHFKRLLPQLSTRGLRRCLNFLVLYPLEQDAVKAASDEEKQFMHLVNSLVEAKFVMIMHSNFANAQALYDAQNAELTEEQKAEAVATLRAGGVSEEEIARLSAQHNVTVTEGQGE